MKNAEKHRIIIVGCGAAGIMAGIAAADYSNDILVLESNESGGKKLAATGNGKCNYANRNNDRIMYRGENPDIVYEISERLKCDDIIDFFRSIGIPTKEKKGYCYPYSGQASTVKEALLLRLREKGVNTLFSSAVKRIEKQEDTFYIETADKRLFECEKLILATGGCAAKCFGSDGSGLNIAEELGHRIIKPLPALVQLKTSEKHLNTLAGVRTEAIVRIICQSGIYSEEGEIIFAKYGISGIPVMNLSRYAVKEVDGGHEVKIELDFFPDINEYELKNILSKCLLRNMLTVEEALTGLQNKKLIYVMLLKAGIKPDDRADIRMSGKLIKQMKHFEMKITGDNGFDNAQVTQGGISLCDINTETMESKKCRGLYFAGEILDADGACGGYNLQWAWCTGAIAGTCAGGGYFDKDQFIKIQNEAFG